MTSRRFQLDRTMRKPPVQADMYVESAPEFAIYGFPSLRDLGDYQDTKRTTTHAVGSTDAKLADETWKAEGIVVVHVEEAYPAGIVRRQSIRPTDHQSPPTTRSETMVCPSEPEIKETDA